MKHTFTAGALFLLVVLLLPDAARAQQGKLIILSPKVGMEIDAAEAAEYDLFGTVRDFHSAHCYQREDGTFSMVIRRRTGDNGVVDSTTGETYRSLTLMADRIEHWELLRRGEYRLGTDIPTLSYEDGSRVSADGDARIVPLQSDSVARQSADVSNQTVRFERNNLPLARPSEGMARPKFKSVDFVVSLGASFIDVKEMNELLDVGGGFRVHAGMHLAVHLSDRYRVRWMGGWSVSPAMSGGIEFHTFSTTILWRVFDQHSVSPILGIGGGRSYYRADNSGILVRADYAYPMLALGLSMEHPKLDMLFTYSGGNISTAFEEKSYTISLAGPSLQIMLSL